MRVLLIALLAAISYAQTGWQRNYPPLVSTKYNDEVLESLKIINKSDEGYVKFFNYELNAPNVLDFDLDPDIMDEIRDEFNEHIRDFVLLNDSRSEFEYGTGDHSFFVMTMHSWHSDIRWVSANNLETYHFYLEYVRRLGLLDLFSRLIDYDERMIVYSIFFVIRSKCNGHNFHVDWTKGNNVNAYTLMTPLERPNIHLAFKDADGEEQTYFYEENQGIAFGEGFRHSTDIGKDSGARSMFCITIGTDKERDWDVIADTATYQGGHFWHPKEGFIKNTREWSQSIDVDFKRSEL